MPRFGITIFIMSVVLMGRSALGAEAGASVPSLREQQMLSAMGPSARNATVIVEGRVLRLMLPTSSIEVMVSSTIKGEPLEGKIIVNISKVAFGRWPNTEDNIILCLKKGARATYELSSYFASILPVDDFVTKELKKIVESSKSETKTTTTQKPQAKVGDANPYKAVVSEAQTVLAGGLTGIVTLEDGARVATFKVEKSYLGYGKFRAPLRVRFAATNKMPLSSGRYLLFMKQSKVGLGFDVVRAERLGSARDAELATQVGKAVGKDVRNLTTFEATLASWEDAWNNKDVAKIISCFSRSSALRKQYDSDEKIRATLAAQVKTFDGKITTSVKSSKNSFSPVEGTDFEFSILVRVGLTLRSGQDTDSRVTTMTFVKEDGEWLIFDEGF